MRDRICTSWGFRIVWEDHARACLRDDSRTDSQTAAASLHAYTHCLSREALLHLTSTLDEPNSTTASPRNYSPCQGAYWMKQQLPWVSTHWRLSRKELTLCEERRTVSLVGSILSVKGLTLGELGRTPVSQVEYTLSNPFNYVKLRSPFFNSHWRLLRLLLTLFDGLEYYLTLSVPLMISH